MPIFEYVGPHDEVDLEGHGSVKRGLWVTVPASEADGLRAQPGNWREKKTTSKGKES